MIREHDLERAECPCGGEHFYADHPGAGAGVGPHEGGARTRVRARALLSPSWIGVYLCVLAWAAVAYIAITGGTA